MSSAAVSPEELDSMRQAQQEKKREYDIMQQRTYKPTRALC